MMDVSPDRLQAMSAAVLANNLPKIRLLLKAGVPADGEWEKTHFLTLAAMHGREEIFDLLAAHGANIKRPDLLAWSVDGGGGRNRPSLGIVQKVLAATEADPETLTAALRFACVSGCPDVVRLLLSEGADPNGVDPDYKYFPLFNAVSEGRAEVVRVLLDAGADPKTPVDVVERSAGNPDARDARYPASLIEIAQNAGHTEIVELLTAYAAVTWIGGPQRSRRSA